MQWAENEQCAKHLIYMWAEQYVVYDWIRLYAHCDTTRRNFLSAILRNADKGVLLKAHDMPFYLGNGLKMTLENLIEHGFT